MIGPGKQMNQNGTLLLCLENVGITKSRGYLESVQSRWAMIFRVQKEQELLGRRGLSMS